MFWMSHCPGVLEPSNHPISFHCFSIFLSFCFCLCVFVCGFFGTPLMQIGDFCFLGCIHPQIIDALKFTVQSSSSVLLPLQAVGRLKIQSIIYSHTYLKLYTPHPTSAKCSCRLASSSLSCMCVFCFWGQLGKTF